MTDRPIDSSQEETTRLRGCYEPPRLTCLGTLADLTQGGDVGLADGAGDAGASGTILP